MRTIVQHISLGLLKDKPPMMNSYTPSVNKMRNLINSGSMLRFSFMMVALSFSSIGLAQLVVTAPTDTIVDCNTPTTPGVLGTATATGGCVLLPWINEFHYDNEGGDVGEFVEIAGPAGFDLTGWTLVRYNGSTPGAAVVYSSPSCTALGGTIDNEGSGFGALSFSCSVDGLQNGGNDGFALVSPANVVIELLSYEGVFTASNGPASGQSSTDVGVAESGTTPIGFSIQRIGTGNMGGDFTWQAPAAGSAGTLNSGQTMSPAPPGVVFASSDMTSAGNQNCPESIIISRTWTATDDCGNTATDVQTITVQDTVPPTFVCPSNVTVNPNDPTDPSSTGMPSNMMDNCSMSVGATFSDVTETNCPAAPDRIVRTWTVSDGCGNSATCDQIIFITCGQIATGACCLPTGECQTLSESDCSLANGIYNGDGSSCTAINCNATCDVNCPDPGPFTIEWPTGFNTDPVGPDTPQDPSIDPELYGAPEGDDCDLENVSYQDVITFLGNCPNALWQVVRVWTIEDGSPNSCTQSFVFTDFTPPTITCDQGQSIECGETAALIPATATDNCDPNPLVTFVSERITEADDCPLQYYLRRVWRAVDNCGNSASCTQFIAINDTTPPDLVCPDDVTVECSADNLAGLNAWIASEFIATDACSDNLTTFVDVIVDEDNCVEGDYILQATVYYAVQDNCGNSASCSRTYTVIDTEGPTMECTKPAPTTCMDHVIHSSELIAMGYASATDVCDSNPTVYVIDSAMTANGCTQSWTYSFTAVDACGNQGDTCGIIVQAYFDETPPTINCTNPPHLGCNPTTIPTAQNLLNQGYVTAMDNCGTPTIGLIPPITTTANGCTRTRSFRFRATDICGHQSPICTVLVTWKVDTVAPVVNCPAPIFLQCTTDPIPVPNPALVTATDDCGMANVTWVSDLSDGLTCPTTITRTYEAADSCGNTSICTQYIIIDDTIAPEISCPGLVVVECNVDTIPVTMASVTDNCDANPTVTYVDVEYPQNCANFVFIDGYDQVITLIVRTFTATDDCGNTAQCTQHILYRDDLPPMMVCPPDVTIECTDDPSDLTLTGEPTVTDLCDPDAYATILFDDVFEVSTCETVITRYWIATDFCGNGNSGALCSQVIRILDTTPPSITCPEAVTIECGDPLPTDLANATDNCNEFIVTYSDSDPVGTCPMIITRTHYATDACGNVSSCTQIITIEDTTPPELTCPPSLVVECGDPIPMICPRAMDICSAGVIIDETSGMLEDGDPLMDGAFFNGACITPWDLGERFYDTYTVLITEPGLYVFTGIFGPEVSFDPEDDGMGALFAGTFDPNNPCDNFVAGSDDDNANSFWDPQIFACQLEPGEYTLVSTSYWGENPEMAYSWTIEYRNIQLSSVDSDPVVVDDCTTMITRTHYAADECGNTSSCTQYIYFVDTTPPDITCPPTVFAECNVDPIPTTLATATDVCSAVTVTYTDEIVETECNNGVIYFGQDQVLYYIIRTHHATDVCGNESTCTQYIVIRDDTPPMVTCPVDVTIECDQDINDFALVGEPIVSDLCDPNAFATIILDQLLFESQCSTVYRRVWQATDQCGNGNSGGLCVQLITLLDTTPPSITCPEDVTIECGDDLPTTLATANDNCGEAMLTYSDSDITGLCPMLIVRTHYAMDECGNTSSCTQHVVIEDTTPPSITCPLDVTIECGDPLPTTLASATDVCDPDVIVTYSDNSLTDNDACSWLIFRTHYATDRCGNVATCIQLIRIEDTTPPTITCPDPVTIECGDPLPTTEATAADICDSDPFVTLISEVSTEDIDGSCLYYVIRTFRAQDACGLSSSCTQVVTVEDHTPPTISCPADITIECGSEIPFTQATATDLCSEISFTFVDSAPLGSCPMVVTRTHYAMDICGNVSSCTQHIVIEDTSAPIFGGMISAECIGSAPPYCNQPQDTPGFSSSPGCEASVCGVDPFCCDIAWDAICAEEALELCCGCLSPDAQPGGPPPAIYCDQPQEGAGFPYAPCEEAVCNLDPFCCDTEWDEICADQAAILPECCACLENPDPACVAQTNGGCGSFTVECGDDVPVVQPDVTDICDPNPAVTYVDASVPGECPVVTQITRTWFAQDECGNISTCTQTIYIVDTTPPSITCPPMVFLECNVDPIPTTLATATDICSDVTLTYSDEIVETECGNGVIYFGQDQVLYYIIRTHYAMDDCGNTASCTQYLVVRDDTPPMVICPDDVTIECDQDINDFLLVGEPIVSDLCDPNAYATIILDEPLFVSQCSTVFRRVWQATDQCGNGNSGGLCVQLITLLDTTPPSITCPEDVTIECGDDLPTTLATAADNCGEPILTYSDGPVTGVCPMVIVRTHYAADICGNVSSCTQHIVIEDTTPPTISCPADVTIECGDPLPTTLAMAMDVCDPDVQLTYSDFTPSDNGGCSWLVVRTHYATDVCGNVATCVQLILIEDTTPPMISCPADVTIECGDPLPVSAATATDICDSDPFVTMISEVSTQDIEGSCLYHVIRTFRAQDACGLSSSCTQVITVEDTTPPDITCPEDFTVSCDELTCLTFDDVMVGANGPLVDISTVNAGGVSINISAWSKAGTPQTPRLFNTEDPHEDCDDLGTPNILYGGPGLSGDNIFQFEPSNSEPRGKAVVVQTPSLPFPDDYLLSDSLRFVFSEPVFIVSLVAVDFETPQVETGAGVSMWDENGAFLGFVPFTGGADNNVEEVYLQKAGVKRLRVYYGNVIPTSGGIADLCFIYVPKNTEDVIVSDACNEVEVSCDSEEYTVVDECLTQIVRTFSAADACGNQSGTCTRTISLETDTEQPVINCPADLTIDCSATPPVPNTMLVTATDNCTAPENILIEFVRDSLYEIECQSFVVRVYRATDECGNSAMCAQFIYFADTTPPAIQCPASITIECGDPLPVTMATATDDCNEVTFTYVDGEAAGSCPAVVTRTHYAMDACGNTSSCTQYIYLEDTTPPMITCPDPFTVECGDPLPMVCPKAIDVCTETVLIAETSGTLEDGDPLMNGAFFAGACVTPWDQGERFYDTYTVQITEPGLYVFTGIFGPEVSFDPEDDGMGALFAGAFDPNNPCDNFVAGSDDDRPNSFWDPQIFACQLEPGEYTLVSTSYWGENPEMSYNWTIEYTNIQLSSVDSDPVELDGCLQMVTRTHYATDECGNTSSCTQYIYIIDTTPPSITCPPDMTLECDVMIPDVTATATDICDDEVEVTYVDTYYPQMCNDTTFVDGEFKVLYLIVRTHYATDDCGNTSECTQHIVIRDDTPPQVTCPPDITIDCSASILPENTGRPIVTDNCDPEPTPTYIDLVDDSTFCTPVISRVWSATDHCGNGLSSNVCVQIITIVDTTPPSITCPDNVTIECGDALPTTLATATDDCTAVTVTYTDGPVTGDCPMRVVRTHYATDACGNVSSCTQYIDIYDTTPPAIVCPGDLTLECNVDPIPTTLATGTDICDSDLEFTYVDVEYPQDCNNGVIIEGVDQVLMIIVRTHYASDDCGNTSSCTQHIVIRDDTPPMVTCPADITIDCEQDYTDVELTGIPIVTDLCDPDPSVTIILDEVLPGSSPCSTVVRRVWQATDHCANGNSGGLCVQLITILDTTAPEISCPADITIECGSELPFTSATATDNCNEITYTYSDSDPVGSCPMVVTRTHYASDVCGNTSSCTQKIYIYDTTPPVFVGGGVGQGPYCDVPNDGVGFPSNLPCQDAVCNIDPFCCQVAWDGICADEAAQQPECCTCLQVPACDDGCAPMTVECGDPIPVVYPTIVDICDPNATVTYSDSDPEPGECPVVEVITRTWTAQDECGNTSTCVQFIYIEDTTPPTIVCPPDMTLECQIPIPTTLATATDICDDSVFVTYSDEVVDTECSPTVFYDGEKKVLFLVVRTHYAIDDCGNVASCTQHFVMRDDTPPTITCPPNITIECTESTDPENTGWPIVVDNCDPNPQPIWFDLDPVGDGCQSMFIRAWTATDHCGNGASSNICIQTITIVDTTPPSITCPANVTIECGGPLPTTLATGEDACNGVMFSYTDSAPVGICPMVITRTHVAMDSCGNQSMCTQYIYIEDTTPPTVVCPPNVTIECAVDPVPTTLATATDNCDNEVFVTYSDVEYPQECDNEVFIEGVDQVLSIIVRTHRAVDDCGNVSSCTQHIVIRDDTPPTIICPPAVTIQCDQDPNDLELTGVPIISDLCDPDPSYTIVITYPTYTSQCSTVLQRVWLATDHCGNGNSSGLCAQTITIVDTTPPSIVCPADITLECGDPIPMTCPGATDNCAVVEFVAEFSGELDVEDPVQSGAFFSFGCFDGICDRSYETNTVVITEPGTYIFTGVFDSLGALNLEATDGMGGLFLGSFDPNNPCENFVAGSDDDNPNSLLDPLIITCVLQPGTYELVSTSFWCNNPEMSYSWTVERTDVSFSHVDSEPMGNCPMVIERTHYATDSCGNTSSCVQYIFIEDTTPPVINCPAGVTIECGDPLPTALATATDICDQDVDVTYVDSPINDGQSGCSWTVARTHYATDDCGNVASCVQIIVIVDTTPPVISCPADITAECGTEAPITNATATDVCSDLVFVTMVGESELPGGTSCAYTIVRTFQATDECGNSSICTQHVNVFDTTPPEVSCPADFTVECTEKTCIDFSQYAVTANGPLITLTSITQGGVTATFTGKSKGNILRPVTVFNSSDPHAGCDDLGSPSELYGGPGISTTAPGGAPSNNQSLGNVMIIQNPATTFPDDYFLSDTIIMMFDKPVFLESFVNLDFEFEQIADGAGVFIFQDGIAVPTFIGFNPALGNDNSMEQVAVHMPGVVKLKFYYGTTVPTSGAIGNICYHYIPKDDAVTSDNCNEDITVTCEEETVFVDECQSQIIRTYSAEDGCGNVNDGACSQTITLLTDGLQPDIICPDDITIGCNDPVPAPNPAGVVVTDNCSASGDIFVTWVQDIVDSTGCDEVIRRIYLAIDECDNEALCVQFISRSNVQPPLMIQLNAHIMLGGSMSPGGQEMYAMIHDILPEDQPYTMSPYNYTGSENVPSFPPNIVDWVLVDLRDAVTMEVISVRAALVTTTGDLVDLDGVSPISFVATPDQYYVVVCHRNHLDVMSDGPVDFTGSMGSVDFTLGNAGMLEVAPGMWAMIKGDVNADGLVNSTDLVQLAPNAAVGYSNQYLQYDVNMDGLVNSTDLVILAPFAAIGYAQQF